MRGKAFTIGGLLAILAGLVPLLSLPPAASAGYDVWTTRNLVNYTLTDLAIDPEAAQNLHLAAEQGMLYSPDGGSQWWEKEVPFRSPQFVVADARVPGTFYAGAGGKLYQSADRGATWTVVGPDVVKSPLYIVFDPHDDDSIFVGTNDGVLRSSDRGKTWSGLGVPVRGRIPAMALDPVDPSVLFAMTESNGLFKSTDGGKSWTQVEWELSRVRIDTLAVDPADHRTCYAHGSGKIYKSTDAGASWAEVAMGEAGSAQWLSIDPQRGGRLYVVGNNSVLYRSDDGGGSWTPMGAGLPERNSPTKLIFDPQVPDVLYGIVRSQVWKSFDGGANWSLPQSTHVVTRFVADPRNPAHVLGVVSPGQVIKSENQGATWETLGNPLPDEGQISALAVDLLQPARLYAGTAQGLYVREEEGAEWVLTGLPPNVSVRAVAVDPRDSDRLLVSGSNNIFVSTNRGTSWTLAMSQGASVLIFHPDEPDHVFAIARSGIYSGTGIARSTDGGLTWQVATVPSGYGVLSLLIDADSPETIYAGTTSGFLKSADGGVTWTPTGSGLPRGAWMRSLAIDPNNTDIFYVATNQGVYVGLDRGEHWLPLSEGLGIVELSQLVALAVEPTALLVLGTSETWSYYLNAGPVWEYAVGTVPTPPPTSTPTPTTTPRSTLTPWPTNTPWPSPTRMVMATASATSPPPRATATAAVFIAGTEQARADSEGPAGPDQGGGRAEEGQFPWLPVIGGAAGLLIVLVIIAGFVLRQRRGHPGAMHCPNCGALIAPDSKFCMKCGNRLR